MWVVLRVILIEVLPLLIKWWISQGGTRESAKKRVREVQKENADVALATLERDDEALTLSGELRNRVIVELLRERGLLKAPPRVPPE